MEAGKGLQSGSDSVHRSSDSVGLKHTRKIALVGSASYRPPWVSCLLTNSMAGPHWQAKAPHWGKLANPDLSNPLRIL